MSPPTPLPQVLSPSGSAGTALLLLLLLQGKSNKTTRRTPSRTSKAHCPRTRDFSIFSICFCPCPGQAFAHGRAPALHTSGGPTELGTPEQSSRGHRHSTHLPEACAQGKVTATRVCQLSLSCPRAQGQPRGQLFHLLTWSHCTGLPWHPAQAGQFAAAKPEL